MTDVSQARIFCLIACLLLHLAPLPLPLPPPCFVASFIFLLSASHPSYSSLPESCKAVRLEFQFPPYVPAQLSTPGQGVRIGGMGLTSSKNHSSFDLFCWRLLVSSVWGLSQAGKYGLSCLWYREISVASKPSHKDLNFSSAGLLVVYHASTRYH